MLLLSFVSMGQTVMASVIPKWCIVGAITTERAITFQPPEQVLSTAMNGRIENVSKINKRGGCK